MNKEIVFVGRMQNKTRDYIHNLEREVKLLQQEKQQLHNKIDNAIEYINGAWEMGCYTKTVALYSEELEELLQILKGSDVDE